jgi:hypothetical protein
VLPYHFVPFSARPRRGAFLDQLFIAVRFFGMDVIVSSVVLWVLVLVEGRRAGVRNLWAPIAGNLAVGVSLGLPLFLYLRERRLERPA